MKTKSRLIIGALLCLAINIGLFDASAATFQVVNGGDDAAYSGPPIALLKQLGIIKAPVPGAKKNLAPPGYFQYGNYGIRILGLSASTSPNVIQSRLNTMMYLWGRNAPTDYRNDPAAVNLISPLGGQWFDTATTSFESYRGTVVLTNANVIHEHGGRIVIPVAFPYPAKDFFYQVSCGLTNIGISPLLPVSTNSTTLEEIKFNPQFLGIDPGPNGIIESDFDSSTGILVSGGDDKVFGYEPAGQQIAPSQTNWAWAYRFNASVITTVNSTAGFDALKNQFSHPGQYLTARLYNMSGSQTLVAESSITNAQPTIWIENNGDNVRVHLGDVAQEHCSYHFQQNGDYIASGPFKGWQDLPSPTVEIGGFADIPKNIVYGAIRAVLNPPISP